MRYNRLGNTDVQVSEIGFGCMSLGADYGANARLLHQALELGITFFDTADLYDHGDNERTLGRAFKGVRDRVVLATKVGNRWREDGSGWDWDPSPAHIHRSVHESLKRLQTDRIDLYQFHGGTIDDPIDETIAAFEDLKAEGLIRHYGISSIRPNVIREWVGRSGVASVMMQYSLLDRRPEEEALGLLETHGVGVIARRPVAKGILSDRTDKGQGGYLAYDAQGLGRTVAALRDATAPRDLSQVALRYALAHPAVATVVPGASSMAQLTANARATELPPLGEDELAVLRQLTRADRYDQHR